MSPTRDTKSSKTAKTPKAPAVPSNTNNAESLNPHFWCPPNQPAADYPFTEPRHPPASTGGSPVCFPKPTDETQSESDFQEFVWDIVNAVSRVNTGLFAYKKGISMGLGEVEAGELYRLAIQNYRDLSKKWHAEIADPETWVQPAISHDGYVTEVVVRSRKFSIQTPGQSESHNSTNPPGRG
ncbi:MAG: hypothetical protein AB7J34_03770 [Limisphaerales bacterium]